MLLQSQPLQVLEKDLISYISGKYHLNCDWLLFVSVLCHLRYDWLFLSLDYVIESVIGCFLSPIISAVCHLDCDWLLLALNLRSSCFLISAISSSCFFKLNTCRVLEILV